MLEWAGALTVTMMVSLVLRLGGNRIQHLLGDRFVLAMEKADGADPGNCRNRDARAWLPGTTGNSVIDGAVVKRVEGRRGSDPSESHGNQVGWWCGVETGIQEECHVDHRMGVWRASGDRRVGVGTPSCLEPALSNVTCAKCRQVRRVGHAPDSGLAGRRSASSKWVRGRDGHLDRP